MSETDELNRRWAKPIIPALVEEDKHSIVWDGEKWRHGLSKTYTVEDFERVRLGYGCLNCDEPFEAPFPEVCAVCGYHVAKYQQRDFAEEFEGEKHVGPSTSLAYEYDRLDEWGRRHKFQSGSSILVPRSVK